MSGIDPISQALGKLLADAETRQRQSADVYGQIGEIKELVAGTAKSVAVLVSQFDDHVLATETRFASLEKKYGLLDTRVAGMEMTAARKAGAIGLIAALSAFVSAAIAAIARLG